MSKKGSHPMSTNQTSVFRSLKPHCVALNDANLKFQRSGDTSEGILDALQSLSGVLETNPPQLDTRICDYVFFPISQVFRERSRLPVGHLVLALRCLRVLLRTGWRNITDAGVAIQLLILLTYLADDSAQGTPNVKPKTSEELREASLACMHALFKAVATSEPCVQKLLDTANIPAVGHTVSVLLDGIKQSQSIMTMGAASETLLEFVTCIASPDVLQSFLPGLVSAVSQTITLSSTTRLPFKVLQDLLQTLTCLIKSVLSDDRLSPLAQKTTDSIDVRSSSWAEATSAQMKVALANVIRLRNHSRPEVREGVRSLCWVVLVDCASSLSDSVQMMFETLAVLDQHQEDHDSTWSLDKLFSSEPAIAEDARSVLYEWIVSLPRIMTSNDVDLKTGHLRKIASVYRLLVDADADLSMIDDMMATNLIEGLSNSLKGVDTVAIARTEKSPQSQGNVVMLQANDKRLSQFPNALSHDGTHAELLKEVQSLATRLATSRSSATIVRRVLDTSQSAQGDLQVISFWLCLSLVRARDESDGELDAYLDLGLDNSNNRDTSQELYAFALSILGQTDGSTELDWRMQAIALEALALQAKRNGVDFRPELVDALYPVVHLMGSPIGPLRDNALVCLNLIAQACDYENAQDLVISNVDYLVNAIGLKINTFDLSPQAPQVLLMMTKLCGPRLLPYLDDLVDGVFEALDCFHGYPKLVELLFSVLNGIAEEGSRAPGLRIEWDKKLSHMKQPRKCPSMKEAISNIGQRRQKALTRSPASSLVEQDTLPEHTPQKPWAELRGNHDGEPTADSPSSSPEGENSSPSSPPPESTSLQGPADAKLSKTHAMLIRIAKLTQHHLPTPFPTTRSLILSLLSRALPALSADEDTFLPLVHTLWPILVPRLHDREAYVVAGVLDVMGLICIGAGDFVSGRVEGIWGILRKIQRDVDGSEAEADSHRRTKRRPPPRTAEGKATTAALRSTVSLLLRAPSPPSPIATTDATTLARRTHAPSVADTTSVAQRYTSTTTTLVRNALTTFLVRLATHVRLPARLVREMTHEMLWRQLVVEGRQDVRGALEVVDGEGVWLVLERARWAGLGYGGEGGLRGQNGGTEQESGRVRMVWWQGRRPDAVGGVEFAEVEVI